MNNLEIRPNSALIVVDLQNDFIDGSLAVPGATEAVYMANKYIAAFDNRPIPVFFTKDWHVANHPSFKEQGGPWPSHCVMYTNGAAHPAYMVRATNERIIDKGVDKEAYSGFEGTSLAKILRVHKVEHVYVCGLATDYCVKATVLDALKERFSVTLLTDAIAAVNRQPRDHLKAIDEMEKAGASIRITEGQLNAAGY